MTAARPPTDSPPAPSKRVAPPPWRIANIIDGRALRVKLTAVAQQDHASDQAMRAAALDILHGALFRGRMIAQERLEQGADGLDTARLLAAVQDEVISALFDFTTTHVFRARNPTEAERIAICATGGYGRGVLAPSSDIDLLVLHSYKKSAHVESVLEYMLYALWDMGLKVGHAFRTPEDCKRLSRADVTIKTSLLDMRFLCGDETLFEQTHALFRSACIEGRDAAFIAAKLTERDERHARQGDTRYVVEPNVKEGKGGLRDLQTLFWIVKHMFGGNTLEEVMRASVFTRADYRRYIRAATFFWTVRCHLHFITGRAEERLSFELQPEIAARMGYHDLGEQLGVERFMKRYFLIARDVGWLTRVLASKLEAERKKKPEGVLSFLQRRNEPKIDEAGFVVDSGRLSIASADLFKETPVAMVRLFTIADQHGLDIHPDALWAITRHLGKFKASLRREADVREAFLDALLASRDVGLTLRRMNEAGVLGRVVPEFGSIVGQTQFNMYHHFTVDEHTLRAVEAIAAIERGDMEDAQLATDVFGLIVHRRALYLAMLLHDTGKGLGDQQVEGEKTARRAAKRLGLSAAESELVAWLVGHHLLMSDTAQKRDISDPRTVANFAEIVGDLERLRLLYVLTVADIKAVGPNVWNSWKGQLLADLYHNAASTLRGGRTDERAVAIVLEERAEARRQELVEELGDVPPVMAAMETAYWTGFEMPELRRHALVLGRVGSAPVAQARERDDGDGVVLLVSGADRIGLFADLVGTIAGMGANIVSAQVFTSPDGHVIDVFVLQTERGESFAHGDAGRLSRLEERARTVFEQDVSPSPVKTRRERREAAFIVEPVVQIRNDVSADFTVIDLSGRDRIGLLFDVAEVLAEERLSIHSAHIGSYGERMFDAFYVHTHEGRKLTEEREIEELKTRLLSVLGRDEPGAPTTPARTLKRAAAVDSF